jgi:hypothetical protein
LLNEPRWIENPRLLNGGRGFLRPEGEHFAFFRTGPGPGALGFRGGELFAGDLRDGLRGLSRYPAPEALATHYSLLKNQLMLKEKVPLALGKTEALREARRAADFQSRHREAYGAFAAAPVPLLVFAWPEEVGAALKEAFAPLLRPFEYDYLLELLSEGLAYYAFYMPHVPRRMGQVAFRSLIGPYAAHGYDRRARMVARRGIDPAAALRGWATLAARMCALGYLPSTSSYVLDQAFSSQNVTLQGGTTSLASLQPAGQAADDAEFYELLYITVMELSNTVRDLTMRPLDNLEKLTRTFAEHFVESDMALASAWVWTELRRAFSEEAKAGDACDPRAREFFSSPCSFGELSRSLDLLFADETKAAWKGMEKTWT